MSHAHDAKGLIRIHNFIDDSIVANTNAPVVFRADEFPRSRRSRIEA